MAQRYQHDFDEELGAFWFGSSAPQSPPTPASRTSRKVRPAPHAESDAEVVARLTNEVIRWERPRRRDRAYWEETGRLVMEYFELKAGAEYSVALHNGFIGWLKRSPSELALYENGDDMMRAALVDWFLTVVR
jgi:hypothetical protein